MVRAIGVDFGTTNSVVALLHEDGSVTTRRYAGDAGPLDVFRSVLCFWAEEGSGPQPPARGGRPGGDRVLSRGPAGQPPDHVDEDIPRAAELHRDAHLRPPLHA